MVSPGLSLPRPEVISAESIFPSWSVSSSSKILCRISSILEYCARISGKNASTVGTDGMFSCGNVEGEGVRSSLMVILG